MEFAFVGPKTNEPTPSSLIYIHSVGVLMDQGLITIRRWSWSQPDLKVLVSTVEFQFNWVSLYPQMCILCTFSGNSLCWTNIHLSVIFQLKRSLISPSPPCWLLFYLLPFIASKKNPNWSGLPPPKYPNIFACPRKDRMNIWIYLDTQELIDQISEYILMPMNWPKKYPNIFGGSWNDEINI